ncbi:MAG: EAL domain-containing protein [Ruminococcus sp.]|jgi:diguanylate cyclase (GGDEF)-like protein|nr:EAL domain-containing protein [Ruminococcus sp.]
MTDTAAISQTIDELLLENRELKKKLSIKKISLKFASDSANVALWEYNPETKILSHSKKLDGKLSDTNLIIDNYRETMKNWGLVHPDDLDTFDAYCDSMDNGDPHFTYEVRLITDDYTFSWVRFVGETLRDETGAIITVVGKTLNVTNEKKSAEATVKNNKEDPVTHVYSGSYIKSYVDEAIHKEHTNTEHLFLAADIDNFRSINEKWGRLYGNYVLEAVASSIIGCLRPDDVVARINSDEFVIFCPNISRSRDEAAEISQKILNILSTLQFKGETHITLSLGGARFPVSGENFDSLYHNASVALQISKDRGKNRFTMFSAVPISLRDETIISDSADVYIERNDLTNIDKPLFDYCFNILTTWDDFSSAVDEIFNETGKHFELDRICLIAKNSTGDLGMFRDWYLNRNLYSEDGKEFADFHNNHRATIAKRYDGNSRFIYRADGQKDEISKSPDFDRFGIKTFIQFPITENEELIGTVTYEDRKNIREWSDTEISTLFSITKMIAAYTLYNRSKLALENETIYTGNVLETQRLTYYVINPKNFELVYISAYASEIFPNLIVGKKCYNAAFGEQYPCAFCPIKNMREHDLDKYTLERYDKIRDTWYTISATKILTSENTAQALVCWTDVTAFLERVSSIDRLTGVLSYEKFKTDATVLIHEKKHPYKVVFAGMRHFNYINDQLGYSIGDEVLKYFAHFFSQILTEDELICRIKGDDFLILMQNDMAAEIGERIKNTVKSLEVMLRVKYPQINLFVHFGSYEVKDTDYSVSSCIDKANRAKKATEDLPAADNHILYDFDYNLGIEEGENLRLENMMYDAMATNQFRVYVQPKVSIDGETIGGAEALIRWITPGGEFIPTFKFVTLFERNGFIIEVDKFVYNTLLRNIRSWLDLGKKPPVVSVNVSRLHLFDEAFPDYLNNLTERYNVPHEYIEVEITESVFFDNTEKLIKMISALRERGFTISMDDFGTGYSTLNLMKSLPIDIVKIDSGFFLRNEMDRKSRAVISSIIHLCKNLDLKIVCEGIETEEQVQFIKSEYCDYAQGFYYYRPMPIEQFAKLI